MQLDQDGNPIGLTPLEVLEAQDRLFSEIPAAEAWVAGYNDCRNGRKPRVGLYFVNRELIHISWMDYRCGWRAAREDLAAQPQLPGLFDQEATQ